MACRTAVSEVAPSDASSPEGRECAGAKTTPAAISTETERIDMIEPRQEFTHSGGCRYETVLTEYRPDSQLRHAVAVGRSASASTRFSAN